MDKDMRKVPLGTHYTSLGSHPDVPRQTLVPMWLAGIFFVVFMVAFVFSMKDYFATSKTSDFYLGLLTIIVNSYFLVEAKYNWKQLSKFNHWLLSLPAILFLFGLYLLLKP